MKCLTPYIRKDQQEPVPCGRCPNCYKNRVSGWAFRLIYEERKCMSAYFITLTYDTKYVPITDTGYLSLCKRDVQMFWKRLRKKHSGNTGSKIKYFVCGEYGGLRNRPHYHAIVFNADVRLLQDSWDKGQIHYGVVAEASVRYTLKYMCKKRKVPEFKGDDREREFQCMSKGLGVSYVNGNMVDWHHADLDNRMYCNMQDKKIAMPRYYKNKIYTEEEREKIAYASKIKADAEKIEYDNQLIAEYGKDWEHKKQEFIIYQFEQMHGNAEKTRNKI